MSIGLRQYLQRAQRWLQHWLYLSRPPEDATHCQGIHERLQPRFPVLTTQSANVPQMVHQDCADTSQDCIRNHSRSAEVTCGVLAVEKIGKSPGLGTT